MTKDELIQHFRLEKHPEGGAFRETYRSDLAVATDAGPRSASTAIYFLLGSGEFSAFHRIRSDELWHFYLGGPLRILEIDEQGKLHETRLGPDIFSGQKLQHTVPAGRWFASIPAEGSRFSLVGCTVAPGFDFADFELADRKELSRHYPEHTALIAQLTR